MTLKDIMKNPVYLVGPILAADDQVQREHIIRCMERFFTGDYGKIPPEDTAANNSELEAGAGRIIARYEPAEGMAEDFYIMAYFDQDRPEIDCNYTSVFYCSDY